jgi:hypothetical protein
MCEKVTCGYMVTWGNTNCSSVNFENEKVNPVSSRCYFCLSLRRTRNSYEVLVGRLSVEGSLANATRKQEKALMIGALGTHRNVTG